MNRDALAFVGLGGMGAAMAHRLLDAGFPLTVYNRTAAKADPLVARGARRAASAAAAMHRARTVIVSLSDDAAVEQVLFGEPDNGPAAGTLVIDTTTVSPAYARDAAERLGLLGARRVEACVVGNPSMARTGKLRILLAGDAPDVDAVRDLLATLGTTLVRVGGPGTACVLKLAFNMLLGTQTVALAEAISLTDAAGMDRDAVIDALTGSGFASPTLAFRAEFMRRRRYRPAAFRGALMEKDLRLALNTAAGHGLDLPVTDRAAERFAAAVAAGDGDEDASAVLELQGAKGRH